MFFSGERLKVARKYRNLTIDKLVQEMLDKHDLKINKGMVSRWENNKATPREKSVKALTSILDVDINFLTGVMSLENVIKELRFKQNMSTEELSKKSGLKHDLISRIESGFITPTNIELDKIGDALGVFNFHSYLLEREIPVYASDLSNPSEDLIARDLELEYLLRQDPRKNFEDFMGITHLKNLHTILTELKEVYYKERLLTENELLKIKRMVEIILEEEPQ